MHKSNKQVEFAGGTVKPIAAAHNKLVLQNDSLSIHVIAACAEICHKFVRSDFFGAGTSILKDVRLKPTSDIDQRVIAPTSEFLFQLNNLIFITQALIIEFYDFGRVGKDSVVLFEDVIIQSACSLLNSVGIVCSPDDLKRIKSADTKFN